MDLRQILLAAILVLVVFGCATIFMVRRGWLPSPFTTKKEPGQEDDQDGSS